MQLQRLPIFFGTIFSVAVVLTAWGQTAQTTHGQTAVPPKPAVTAPVPPAAPTEKTQWTGRDALIMAQRDAIIASNNANAAQVQLQSLQSQYTALQLQLPTLQKQAQAAQAGYQVAIKTARAAAGATPEADWNLDEQKVIFVKAAGAPK